MGVFDRFGVRQIINVGGSNTRLGGPLMAPEVVEAMSQAATESVAMEELQAAASRVISDATGAEAGYVTAGAAAGLTLGTAACITGLDISKMDRLPDTAGMPNEVIIAREHRSGYDHAIRAAGARLVEVGMNEVGSGAGVRASEAWEYEAAITEKTTAIAYFFVPGSNPPLEQVIRVAHKHNLPVIVDAAAQLPPVENLRRFTGLGADLVAFSGGKSIRGPQNSGILCGRRDLIAAVALQHLDLDEHFDIWEPPPSLIPKEKLPGIPRHGIGRSAKVSKEAVIGLLTALQMFTREQTIADSLRFRSLLQPIVDGLREVSNIEVNLISPPNPEVYPTVEIRLDEEGLGQTAFAVSRTLKYGDPSVYLNETQLAQGILEVNPINLTAERAAIVAERLVQVLGTR